MKLEQQVVSLELSKKLKMLGVKQESLFYWTEGHVSHEVGSTRHGMKLGYWPFGKVEHTKYDFSAFTVAEFGEMMHRFKMPYLAGGTSVWYSDVPIPHYLNTADTNLTEADARAKMLVYLLEQKLTTLK